jgi:hypothetical protein
MGAAIAKGIEVVRSNSKEILEHVAARQVTELSGRAKHSKNRREPVVAVFSRFSAAARAGAETRCRPAFAARLSSRPSKCVLL